MCACGVYTHLIIISHDRAWEILTMNRAVSIWCRWCESARLSLTLKQKMHWNFFNFILFPPCVCVCICIYLYIYIFCIYIPPQYIELCIMINYIFMCLRWIIALMCAPNCRKICFFFVGFSRKFDCTNLRHIHILMYTVYVC